jgi:hypothetical protein
VCYRGEGNGLNRQLGCGEAVHASVESSTRLRYGHQVVRDVRWGGGPMAARAGAPRGTTRGSTRVTHRSSSALRTDRWAPTCLDVHVRRCPTWRPTTSCAFAFLRFLLFDLALFDQVFLQNFELKCSKKLILKLYISLPSTTYTKAHRVFSQRILHELLVNFEFFFALVNSNSCY